MTGNDGVGYGHVAVFGDGVGVANAAGLDFDEDFIFFGVLELFFDDFEGGT